MTSVKENVQVTIPAMDIEEREAQVVKMASIRFSIWWNNTHIPEYTNTPNSDPDMTVPNEMIIVEF